MVGALAASITTAGASLALFTDTETVDGVFTTGTIVLDAAQIDGLTLSTGALMPGDKITDDVVVENDGTAELRYAVSATSTDADGKGLRTQLTVTVKTGVTDCSAAGFDADGTVLRTTVALGATTVIFGDPAAGADTGDRDLAAGGSETLCFQVALPLATGNAYQGAATTTTFTFDAEQTANNA
jgi:predicted ribosomally synthesized peptide with SipW-like signal peptide